MATSKIPMKSSLFVRSTQKNNDHTISLDLSNINLSYGVTWVFTGRKYAQNKAYGAMGVVAIGSGNGDAIVLSSVNLGTVTASYASNVLTVSWTGDDVSYMKLSVLFEA